MKGPLKIHKNVPLPPSKHANTGVVQQMREMKLGDSFISPWGHPSSPHNFARMAGIRVCCRTEQDGAVRVWRVA